MMVRVLISSLILFSFLTLCNNIYAIKTPDRWIPYKDDKVRCIVTVTKQKYKFGYNDVIADHEPYVNRWISKANCTINQIIYTTSGTPNASGHYDGFIGIAQRNEADFVFIVIRPDSLPFQPGKPTPPIQGESIVIVSKKNTSLENAVIFREVTSFLDLNSTVYAYTLITLFFMSPVILLFDKFYGEKKAKRIKNKPIKIRSIIKAFTSSCYKMYTLLVDQEQFTPSTITGYTVIVSASLFTLFSVHGILFNTIGADLIVRKEPPVIDTLDDLLESNLIPVLNRKFTEYDLIKSSPPDHPLHKLWLRMQQNITKSIFDADLENEDIYVKTNDLINRLMKSEVSIISPNSYSIHFHKISCLAQSYIYSLYKFIRSAHFSKEKLAHGYSAVLFSNEIHPYTEKVLTYSARLVFESSLLKGAFQAYLPHASSYALDPSVRYDRKAVICIEGEKEEDTESFRPYKARDLFKLFEYWALLSCLSSLVLVIELLIGMLMMKKRSD